MTSDIGFPLDVDDTLLDNDRIIADLRRRLEHAFGVASAQRFRGRRAARWLGDSGPAKA